jgi:hypothetical protein
MDRTAPPVRIPEGEAADGVVDVVDRASMALTKIKARASSRVSRTSRVSKPTKARSSMAVRVKAKGRIAATAAPRDLIGRNSVVRAMAP